MRSMRILLVEDLKVNVDLARIILERKGHTVTVAWNGHEAIEAFVPGEFDVILMDIQMPRMNGIKATEQIRTIESGTGGHVPIIAMTGGVMEDETDGYLEAGMDAVVAKPVDPKKLYETIERVVP